MMKIGIVSNVSTDIYAFEEAAKLTDMDVMVYDLKGDFDKFKEFCKDCCVVIAKLMGGKNVFPVEEFHRYLVENGVHFCPLPTIYEPESELKKYSTVREDVREKVMEYLAYEGIENYKNLLLYLARELCGADVDYEGPKKLPWQGIYYKGKVYGKEFLERLDPEKPTIGILFYRSWWVGNDIKHIDALINELEKYANVIAIFSDRRPNELGSWGMERSVKEFFTKDGKVIIDVLVNTTMFSLTTSFFNLQKFDFLRELDVPLLQAVVGTTFMEDWAESKQGLSPIDVVICAAMPEFDSAIIHFPIACKKKVGVGRTSASIVKIEPIPDRVKKFGELVVKYANLRRKKNSEKRVAIVLHNYPPRNDRIASAFGLDSPESVVRILKKMKERGYKIDWIPEDGNGLINKILENVTNDEKFLTVEIAKKMAVDKFDLELPEKVSKEISNRWDEKTFMFEGKILLPILRNGNVLIGLQPPRGYNIAIDEAYHDPELPPTHQYVAFYKYISKVFKADAIIHVGKHGTMEWLPGKSFGLSENCYPDVCMEIPHFYIYIVNNPGEGTQAKRRGYACLIDHLPPPFTTADLYEDYLLLEKMIEDYYEASRYGRGEDYARKILEKAREINLIEEDVEIEKIHELLLEMKISMINLGLHVFGEGLSGEKLVETILSITRIKRDGKSILDIAAEELGYDLSLPNEECVKKYGKTKSKIYDLVLEKARTIITEILEGKREDKFIEELRSKLEVNKELEELMLALEGHYVKAGMSGAITRNPKALPTGKNFYSCNPWELPTPEAYERGKKLAELLLNRYIEEEGKYPETVGIVVWASPTMRTHGEDVAEVLYLLGVKPKYDQIGRVCGLEVISLEELGRPRIDVVVRISGMFRDAFYNLVELMDDAFKLVASLDEPEEMNYVKKHCEGEPVRIFGDMPGAHGAGVNHILENKNWESIDDLARAYINWGCYAYGRGKYGVKAENEFREAFKIIEVAVKNEDSQEWDLFESDDFNNYHGGMIATVKALGGDPKSYVGDSSDPDKIKVRSLGEECKRVYRVKVMNPKWIDEMKKHGYKGAEYFSKYVDHIFQWDATSDVIDDWMYSGIAEKYVFNKEMQEFFKKNNPYALMNITERLLEAIDRGMWETSDDVKEKLRELYLKLEGELE